MTDSSCAHPHWAPILPSQITLSGLGCPLILRILRYLKNNAQLSSYLKKKKRMTAEFSNHDEKDPLLTTGEHLYYLPINDILAFS